MNTSEHINEIAKALASAQLTMENAGKNAVNPHFKNKYADLAEVLNVVRPALAAQGIAIVQLTSTQGDALVLHTRMIHNSGQWIESEYPVCKFPATSQQMGAAMTYARRYSLASVCGIAQEDDDLADGKGTAPVAAPKKTVGTVSRADDEAARQMMVKEGEAVARDGIDALAKWWKALAPADRETIGQDTLALLKSHAAEVTSTQEAPQ